MADAAVWIVHWTRLIGSPLKTRTVNPRILCCMQPLRFASTEYQTQKITRCMEQLRSSLFFGFARSHIEKLQNHSKRRGHSTLGWSFDVTNSELYWQYHLSISALSNLFMEWSHTSISPRNWGYPPTISFLLVQNMRLATYRSWRWQRSKFLTRSNSCRQKHRAFTWASFALQ